MVRGGGSEWGDFREGGQGLEFGGSRKESGKKKERDLWVTSGDRKEMEWTKKVTSVAPLLSCLYQEALGLNLSYPEVANPTVWTGPGPIC